MWTQGQYTRKAQDGMFDPTSNGVSLGHGYPLSSTPAEFLLVRKGIQTRATGLISSRVNALTLFILHILSLAICFAQRMECHRRYEGGSAETWCS